MNTVILTKESRRRKRSISGKAHRALKDLKNALELMRQFAEDHGEIYRNHQSKEDLVILDMLAHDLGSMQIYSGRHADDAVEDLIHSFDALSEDKKS